MVRLACLILFLQSKRLFIQNGTITLEIQIIEKYMHTNAMIKIGMLSNRKNMIITGWSIRKHLKRVIKWIRSDKMKIINSGVDNNEQTGR